MNEFILVIGMILTGAILFLSSGGYLIHEIEETEGYGVKGTAERIASIMERMYGEPAYARYCINISLSNLKIEQGYMTFEQKEKKYVLPVPKEVKNVDLKEIASICFVRHKTGEIELLEKPPVCDMNGVCTAEECSEECKDCYGPAPICIGDESCDIYIGENCRNSIDCACSLKNGSYVCCPDDPSSDEQGCVDEQRQNLSKGEKCFCDNECDTSTNLICNKVSLGFTDYKKACCPPGYGWDGTDCVALECSYPCAPNCKLPDKWDWRNVDGVNWMNPIRAQAVCGSCWAFSAVAGVEHRYNVEQNCPACNKKLSEQNMVSSCCSAGDCLGGWHYKGLGFAISPGIVDENCFPYTSTPCVAKQGDRLVCLSRCTHGGVCSYPGSCNSKCADWNAHLWKIGGYTGVRTNTKDIKRALICQGPLSMALTSIAHAVMLAGYDDSTNQWIIRNSWGVIDGVKHEIPHTKGYGFVSYSNIRMVYYAKNVKSP